MSAPTIAAHLAALLGKRVTVYLWIRSGFVHFSAELVTTGAGNYHVTVLEGGDSPSAGAVFTADDVENIGAFPDGRERITLKAEARAK